MSELKPCPFCNGSQEATQDSRGKWRGSHECDFVDPSAWFDTYEEFKETWNARCERTCTPIRRGTIISCGVCGSELHEPFRFCGSCGAKVVEE